MYHSIEEIPYKILRRIYKVTYGKICIWVVYWINPNDINCISYIDKSII